MSHHFILSFLLVCYIHIGVTAQTAYYTNLLEELNMTYGLNGGELVIGGDESFLQAGNHSGFAPQFQQINDQNFQQSSRMFVSSAGPNPWSQQVSYLTTEDINADDVLLLTAYVRAHNSSTSSEMAFSFQEAEEPWSNSDYKVFDIPGNGQWYRIFHPLDANQFHPAGQTILQLHLGIENIDFEIGGLALINYKQAYTLADLPTKSILYYEGIEADAPWRTAALNRIEQHRKANLEIQVLDANNNPIQGADVQIEMQQSQFKYGSFEAVVLLNGEPSWDFYQSEFYRLFNYATTGIYWSSNEEDNYQLALAATNNLVQNGLDVRVHPVLWGTIQPGWSSMPDDIVQAIEQNDAPYVRQRINERIETIADLFGPLITDYDVLNEPLSDRNLQDLLGADEEVVWFEKMRQEDANNQLFINDGGILFFGAEAASVNTYKTVVENLLSQNAPLDGVGFQAHMFDVPTPPKRIYDVIDEFYQLGQTYNEELEFKITEYDTEGMGDELAAMYLSDFLTAIFSHPKVTSFTMWGFWDGLHWLDDGPLYKADWTPKPALSVYEDLLFNQWWTNENQTTNANGIASFRGFKGSYQLTVNYEGQTVQQSINLSNNGNITIHLNQVLDIKELDFGHLTFDAAQVFPSILQKGQLMLIETTMGKMIEQVEIFNIKGDKIYQTTPANKHLYVSTENWAAGVYIIKIGITPQTVVIKSVVVN